MLREKDLAKLMEMAKELTEEDFAQVLGFVEFLRWREEREDLEDARRAEEILKRREWGEEETVPWEEIKARCGLED